jgi:hypothetical protein
MDNNEVIGGASVTKNCIFINNYFEWMEMAFVKRSANEQDVDFIYVTMNECYKLFRGGFIFAGIRGKCTYIDKNRFYYFDSIEAQAGGTTAIGVGGNSTQDANFNVWVRNNHFIEITGAWGVGVEIHWIIVYGRRVNVSGNIGDGCFAWKDGVKGESYEDCEAIYTKGGYTIIDSNIVHNGNVGGGDGAITMKGDGTHNVVTNNIVTQDMDVWPNLSTSLYLNRVNVVANNHVIGGRIWTFCGVENSRASFTGNVVYGRIQLSYDDTSPKWLTYNVTGNTIVNPTTLAAISGSGGAQYLNISDNVILSENGRILATHADYITFENNKCVTNGGDNWIWIDHAHVKTIKVHNNTVILKDAVTVGTLVTRCRLQASQEITYTNNDVEYAGVHLSDGIEYRLSSYDGVVRINNNRTKFKTKYSPTSSYYLIPGRIRARRLEIIGNEWENIDLPSGILSLASHDRIHEIIIKDNKFDGDPYALLSYTATGRLGRIEVDGNQFTTLNRIDRATTASPTFYNHVGIVVKNNRGAVQTEGEGVTGALATEGTVNHGLRWTPSYVHMTPNGAAAPDFFPSALGASTFAVNYSGGGTKAFAWRAVHLPRPAVAPTQPTHVSPANGVSGQSRKPVLTVTDEGQVAYFHVQVATDTGFSSLVVDQKMIGIISGSNIGFDINLLDITLAANTIHYWRVKPLSGVDGSFTAYWSFTTGS